MYPLLTASQMRLCDETTINNGTPSQTLMERAARAAIEIAKSDPAIATALTLTHRILLLCGSGNNGGDGFAMARFLLKEGYDATVVYGGAWANNAPDPTHMSVECAHQYELWCVADGKTLATLPALIPDRTLVIDALFGIGLSRPIEGRLAEWIDIINQGAARGDYPILALDVPSGVDVNTGATLGTAVKATATATFAAPKRGLLLYPAATHVGQLHICDIGISTAPLTDSSTHLLMPDDLSLLPARPAYANKGTFGRVTVIGGASGMCGAPYFAAKTAYRAGAGLVEILTADDNRIPLQTLIPEAVLTTYNLQRPIPENVLSPLLARADSIVLGCGLGQSETAGALVASVLHTATVPVVLDADALNLLANAPTIQDALRARTATTILTPHLGEASRLCSRPIPEIAADLFATSDAIAQAYGVICVLKDARTVVSDGTNRYIQSCGNSGMATGGSGDCLAGLIGSLLAQYHDLCDLSPAHLAALGVLLHAMAGDVAAKDLGEHALMASDLADAVGQVLHHKVPCAE